MPARASANVFIPAHLVNESPMRFPFGEAQHSFRGEEGRPIPLGSFDVHAKPDPGPQQVMSRNGMGDFAIGDDREAQKSRLFHDLHGLVNGGRVRH